MATAEVWIANTVSDLIQGDIQEHLPLERIPLHGDVLGIGTTTSIDNGELAFLKNQQGDTTIWKCQASNGSIRELRPGDGSAHFPYVCFSSDAQAARTPVDLALLSSTGEACLNDLISDAIAILKSRGELPDAPLYGVRLVAEWHSLIITVASKLCMGQQRRNKTIATNSSNEATESRSIYEMLQHYRLCADDPTQANDPIHYLGSSLSWDCCGFWDSEPHTGRVTVPEHGANLHLHGCSTDLRYGGHLIHEHAESRLKALESLILYPIAQVHTLCSDLLIEKLSYNEGIINFTVRNRGSLDVSDVGVAVVIDNNYRTHRYLRLPWLSAEEQEEFNLGLQLTPGEHTLEVIADPERRILEPQSQQANNAMALRVRVDSR